MQIKRPYFVFQIPEHLNRNIKNITNDEKKKSIWLGRELKFTSVLEHKSASPDMLHTRMWRRAMMMMGTSNRLHIQISKLKQLP